MKITCPACGEVLPAAQINVATDVAVCAACDETFSASAVMGSAPDEAFDLAAPPRGAWFTDTGIGWQVGSTTRSWIALILVPFVCIWSGFTLGGIYGAQIIHGEFSLVGSLFGIPFVLGTLLFGALAVMTAWGKVTFSVEGSEASIFTGAGSIGRTQRFDWSSVTGINEITDRGRESPSKEIVLKRAGEPPLQFASGLSDRRRYYFIQAVRLMLKKRG